MHSQSRILDRFEEFVSPVSLALRDVMARITSHRDLFQVVVDTAGRVVGTVTDGDIRRALLAGHSLDEPIERCMARHPLLGRIGDDDGNRRALDKLRTNSPHAIFLPVVDDDGRLQHILLGSPDDHAPPVALVMAGGFGRRLAERTRETPKPLLTVGDRPILEHILRQLEGTGFRRIYISVHYLADQIVRFVETRDSLADITCLHDGSPRGTAGAIAGLPDQPEGSVVVLNGDLITNVDFGALVQFHNRNDADATLAVAQHEFEVPYGVVRHGSDGQFHGIDEKPTVRHFVSAGIYCLSREICALVPNDRPMDMPDLINRGREIGLKVGLFPIHEYWTDIGRPADLDEAHARANANLAAT